MMLPQKLCFFGVVLISIQINDNTAEDILHDWTDWIDEVKCSKNLVGSPDLTLFYKIQKRSCKIQLCNINENMRQYVKCALVDGNWSEFGPWTPCSKSCGYGIKKRYRFCINPKPLFGGNGCQGSNSEKDVCFNKFCLTSDSGSKNIFVFNLKYFSIDAIVLFTLLISLPGASVDILLTFMK